MREQLIEEILKRSRHKVRDAAKFEWTLKDIYYKESSSICLCGQKNIKNICVIKHKETGEECIIGNECIDHFLNQNYKFLFNDIKKIFKDIKKAVSENTINYCVYRGIIDKGNAGLYNLFARRRDIEKLEFQFNLRMEINRKILKYCYKN